MVLFHVNFKLKRTSLLYMAPANLLPVAKASCCLKGLTLFFDDLPTSCFEEKSIKTILPGVAFSI